MTHPIVPHLWFSTQAKEAATWYVSLFPQSRISSVITLPDTPSGNCDLVSFELVGQPFMAISAGPYFTLNPAISFFVICDTHEEIDALYTALSAGGTMLMPYDTYPWAKKYCWLQDRYGVSWQLSLRDDERTKQKITPMLMFTQAVAGKAKEALELYTSVFPQSSIDALALYDANDGDTVGNVKHGRFTLNGQQFMAIDSSLGHQFTFNEAVSLVVTCDTQEEIDHYWEELSAVPAAEQCGWLKDRYGVSWQITPSLIAEVMANGDAKKISRVTKAFLQMKKFDIQKLRDACSD